MCSLRHGLLCGRELRSARRSQRAQIGGRWRRAWSAARSARARPCSTRATLATRSTSSRRDGSRSARRRRWERSSRWRSSVRVRSFGEQALLAPDAKRTASAVALEAVETRVLYRRDANDLRATQPSIDRFLVVLLAGQVRRLSQRVLEALYYPADRRVARRLAELAELYDDGAGADRDRPAPGRPGNDGRDHPIDDQPRPPATRRCRRRRITPRPPRGARSRGLAQASALEPAQIGECAEPGSPATRSGGQLRARRVRCSSARRRLGARGRRGRVSSSDASASVVVGFDRRPRPGRLDEVRCVAVSTTAARPGSGASVLTSGCVSATTAAACAAVDWGTDAIVSGSVVDVALSGAEAMVDCVGALVVVEGGSDVGAMMAASGTRQSRSGAGTGRRDVACAARRPPD